MARRIDLSIPLMHRSLNLFLLPVGDSSIGAVSVTERLYQGAGLIGRAANHLGAPGTGSAFRDVAVDGPGDEETGFEAAREPAPDQHRPDDVVLMPVGRCTDRLAVEERLDVLLADDAFDTVGRAQQLDEPA